MENRVKQMEIFIPSFQRATHLSRLRRSVGQECGPSAFGDQRPM